jgi:hypothetical protein
LWTKERDRLERELKEKRDRKINHLYRKHWNREKDTDNIEGIIVKDQIIDESYESKPRAYGGVEITNEESRLLQLPPKFATYSNINMTDVETEIEAGLVKLRWNRRKGKDHLQNEEGGLENNENGSESNVSSQRDRDWPISVGKDGHTIIDMRSLRPTDLPFNKRVYLPEPLPKEEETKLQEIKQELLHATKQYISEGRTKKLARSKKYCNLSEEEKAGLESLKKKDIVISQTDKSGRFSVDSKDNYIEACKPHYQNDLEVSEEEHLKAQKDINAHATMWSRILKMSALRSFSANYLCRNVIDV